MSRFNQLLVKNIAVAAAAASFSGVATTRVANASAGLQQTASYGYDRDRDGDHDRGKHDDDRNRRRSATNSSPIAITSDDRFVWSVNPDDDSVSLFRVANDANRKLAEIQVGKEPGCR